MESFLVPVEKRDRNTLIPIIEWKHYEIEYEHLKVNHSIQFVNDDGDHTNKIEGHWR